MRNQLIVALAAAVAWSAPAPAVNTEHHQIPYFGVAPNYFIPDGARGSRAESGAGLQFVFGVPLESQESAVELRFSDVGYRRHRDQRRDYQSALFVEYVRDFGTLGETTDSFLGGTKPFVLAGGGFVKEDVLNNNHLHFGLAAGGGLIVPVWYEGWALRLDARVQWQANDESCQNSVDCDGPATSLMDFLVSFGVQMPMSLFFDRPVKVEAVEECPLAVVDPETGRSDCAVDSDRDGIADEVDQCPGTPPGTAVSRQGCAREQVSNDTDRDGVPNPRDECAGTQPGLRVDARGCVIEQTVALRGVSFLADSARLTAEGRSTLDGVADTLAGQRELRVEIAGHTDNVGSEAYNLLLSQQRAESVRLYLMERGISGDRLLAVGYGELEPIANNETEEGRSVNRRVEFRITAE